MARFDVCYPAVTRSSAKNYGTQPAGINPQS